MRLAESVFAMQKYFLILPNHDSFDEIQSNNHTRKIIASLKKIKPIQELKNTYHCFDFFIFFWNVLTVTRKPRNFSQPPFPPLAFQRFLTDVSLPDDIRWDGAASMVRPLFLRFEHHVDNHVVG